MRAPTPAIPPPDACVVPAAVAATARRSRRLVFLRQTALLCAVLVLMISSLSAFIRLSKAGLSCADWPRCYGQSLREQQQGAAQTAHEGRTVAIARTLHRVVASSALVLVLLLVVACVADRPVLWREARVGFALLAVALFLAVLGRWSSDARVPAVAMANLLGGFAMLALCWRLAHRTSAAGATWLRLWAACGVAMLLLQVASGGLLSASFAATSCDALVDCIAASRGLPWSALDPWREPLLAASPPPNMQGALPQMVHRLSALLTVLVLLPLGVAALRNGRRGPGALVLALLAGEFALGLLLTGESVTLVLALAHNLLATLLLAATFELTRGPGTPDLA